MRWSNPVSGQVFGDVYVWTPGAGMTMKLLPNVPAPRNGKFQRLQQMKALTEQFKAEAVDRNDPDKKWFLRPQSKPVFRYGSDSRGIIDGA